MPDPVIHQAKCGAWRIIGRLAFNRITVLGRERLPRSGAVLYVATHRNGALDAAPYTLAVPAAVPMVSAQLHRTLLGRFLFRGIPVARAKDRDRGMTTNNLNSVDRCIDLLQRDGQLLVMPEGTSSLGFRHLPFQRGAARIAHAAVNAGVSLTIVALGVHYEAPTVWQSRVEVLVGRPIRVPSGVDVAAIHRLITLELESVGANFQSMDAQRNADMLAYASTLGTDSAFSLSLKHFEQATPESLADWVRPLMATTLQEHLCRHQGVPLVNLAPLPLYALYWLALASLVTGFSLLNAPVVAAGWVASRILPDAPNVVSFWRMAVGLPVGVLWATLVSAVLLLLGGFAWVGGYWAVTIAGIGVWYRFRKLSVALCNGVFHRSARPALLDAYRALQERMQHG